MKKLILLSLAIFFITIHISWKKSYSSLESLRPWILSELLETKHSLNNALKSLDKPDRLKIYYSESRKHYKHLEFFIEYCSPKQAKYFINGPLVPKYEYEISTEVMEPNGFQKMEELIYDSDSIDKIALEKELKELIQQIENLHKYYETLKIPDELLLEMCQVHLYRITTLNLNGYDATITKENLKETAWSLGGIIKVLESFEPYLKSEEGKTAYRKVQKEIKAANRILVKNKSYDDFNRLDFIVNNISPIYSQIGELHNHCNLPWSNRRQALNLQAKNPFTKEGFNLRYFSIYYDDTLHHSEQAALGHLLFFDPVLSSNNQRSCASCHNPSQAFTDGLPKNKSIITRDLLKRNTPGLIDAVLQKSFFLDGRSYQLEQQVFEVVHNKEEMGGNMEEIVQKLQTSKEYKTLFSRSFSGTNDTSITTYAVIKAISEYEKTLISFKSRFDNFIAGNRNALSTREINGYNLFAGKAQCGSCHFFPLFNGTVPPFYDESEFEVIGTPSGSDNASLDSDLGRYEITKQDIHNNSFKTPTIRNAEHTAPYMHNGVYKSLEEVLDFYHKGGGAGLGYSVRNQTLPFDSLNLTKQEREDIILFMKSLSDTTGLTTKPAFLPSFEDIGINQRVIGERY